MKLFVVYTLFIIGIVIGWFFEHIHFNLNPFYVIGGVFYVMTLIGALIEEVIL